MSVPRDDVLAKRKDPPVAQHRITSFDWKLLLLIAIAIAWLVYRPDRGRPFDVLDFGEFIPTLKAWDSWWSQFTTMVQYGVEQHGRPYIVTNLLTVLKWQLFGSSMIGWQVVSAAQMLAIIAQTHVLLRRLGASELGAALGASIWLFAPAASAGWVRLTLLETTGMVVLLGMCLRATTYQRREHWKADLAWFAAGSVFVILVKEMMAPTLILPVMLVFFVQRDGSIEWTGFSNRNVMLAAVVGVASLAALVPLAAIYLNSSPDALGAQYGTRTTAVSHVLIRWALALVPFDPFAAAPSVVWIVAVFGLVGIVVLGWREAIVRRVSGSRLLLGIGLLFPLLGVVSYAPWPYWEMRYVFPYLLGVSVLIGMGATMLARTSKKGPAIVTVLWIPSLLLGGSESYARSAKSEATSLVVDRVIDVAASTTDSIFIASDIRWIPAWIGLGPTLERFARATDRRWSPMRQIGCGEVSAGQSWSSRRTVIIAFTNHCNATPAATQDILESFSTIDWINWKLKRDSVHAKLFIPAADIERANSGNRR